MEVTTFTCTICGESSRNICIACTKDTCGNHLCERCKRCSDCCVCEVRLIEHHERNGKGFVPVPAETAFFEHSEPAHSEPAHAESTHLESSLDSGQEATPAPEEEERYDHGAQ